MRIIAGTKRGMKLFSPKTADSRPITDKVKESLFDVLASKYGLPNGRRVADLFCGVGSLGLEALSRGADFVTFVEQDPKIVAVLNKNIEKTSFAMQSKVVRANAFKIGAPGDSSGEPYGLIFVDPPYAQTERADALSPLGRLLTLLSEQVTPDGIVVVRTSRATSILERYAKLRVTDRRRWGTMAVAILTRAE